MLETSMIEPVLPAPGEARRRLTLVGLAHGVTHIRGAMLPLIYPMLMRSMGFDYVDLTAMLSVTRFIGGLLQGIWGKVAETVPAKYLIGLENLGVGLGIGMVGVSHNFPELSASVAFGQVAASPQHPIGSAMITRWYPRDRHGFTLAIHSQAGRIATLITPILTTFLLTRVGWHSTVFLFGLAAVVVGGLVMVALPREMVAPKVKRKAAPRFGGGFIAVLGDPLIRRLIIIRIVGASGKGMGTMLTLMPLFFQSLHFQQWTIGLLFTLLTAASVVAPLVSGQLADRFHRGKVLVLLLCGSGFFSAAVAFTGSLGLTVFIPVLMAFGLFVFAYAPIETAIMADLTSRETRAQAYSVYYSVSTTVSAAWPVVLGLVIQFLGFRGFFLIIAASFFIAAVLYRLFRITSALQSAHQGA